MDGGERWKMKKMISFMLCLSLVFPMIVSNAHAEESVSVTFPCQYAVGYDVNQTMVSGDVLDNCLYVNMETVAELSGLILSRSGIEYVLYPSDESKWSSAYILNTDSGNFTEISPFYSNRTWCIPFHMLENDSLMVSFEHILEALNATISCNPQSSTPMSIYRPYTIFDIRKSLLKNDCYFNWCEIDSDATFEDTETMHILSSLNSLFLDYNEHSLVFAPEQTSSKTFRSHWRMF